LVYAPAVASPHQEATPKHLTAVPPPKRVTDRRDARFIPKYVELTLPPNVDDQPNAKRRIRGYGLKAGPADLYSAIIELLGTPLDGKRGTFSPRDPVNASYLRKRYGWTYDQIAAWTKHLVRPQPCPHCERGHALLHVHRAKHGGSYRYALIRCQDLSDDRCIPHADARPTPRKRTGALPGRQPAKTSTPTQTELLPPVAGPVTDIAPLTLDDPRAHVVAGIARLHAIDLSAGAATIIAQHAAEAGAATAADYEAALLRLTASAGIAKTSVNDLGPAAIRSIIAAAPLQMTAAPEPPTILPDVKVSEKPDTFITDAWDINRCLELARRAEPRTTIETAVRYRDEIVGMLRKHGVRDPRTIEDEMARILTDPRIVGPLDRPQRTPFRLIRAAIRDPDPWILTPAHLDDGSGQLARAYAALPIGKREAIERLIADHLAGEPLDFQRLAELGISSKQMIAFVVQRAQGPS
jgi:hypothetical protein